MDGGMILDSPTIFGMKGNSLLGAGEAGSETIVGTQSLMNMIQGAATAGNASMIALMDRYFSSFMELMTDYFPQFANMQMVMDSGALVGQIAPAMDSQLGRIADHKGRGN